MKFPMRRIFFLSSRCRTSIHLLAILPISFLIGVLSNFTLSAFAADRYWIGGTGNWSDTSHWSINSEGIGGAGKPGIGDTAIFDINSGGGTCIFDENISIAVFNMTTGNTTEVNTSANNYALTTSGNFTITSGTFIANGSTITIGGNWDSSGGVFNYGTSRVVLTGSGKTLKASTTGGLWATKFYSLTINSGARITVNSSFMIDRGGLSISGVFSVGSGKTVSLTYLAPLTINGTLAGAGTFYRFVNNLSSHITKDGANYGIISIANFSYIVSGTAQAPAPITAITYGRNLYIYGADIPANCMGSLGGGKETLTVNGSLIICGWANNQGATLDNSAKNIPITVKSGIIMGNTANSSGYGKLIAGSATISVKNVTIAKSDTSGTNEIDADSSIWRVSGNWTNNDVFTADTSTVILTGINQTISGNSTFYNLVKVVTSADTLYFQARKIQTIANNLTLNGVSGGLLLLRSKSPGTQWKINPQGTRSVVFVDVEDSNNTNAKTIFATDSEDSGNNVKWGFGGSECVCRENRFEVIRG